MSTYLVTGAAGFIAAKVCEQLLVDGHVVVGIDNLNDYYDVRIKDHRLAQLLGLKGWNAGSSSSNSIFAASGRLVKEPEAGGRFVFEPVDIENGPKVRQLFTEFRFDAVFNLAARAGVRCSVENPYVYLSTNTLGALNLLECQRRFGVAKLVQASTSSLYAGCKMPFTEDLAVNEPLSPYAATKKAAELLAHSYHKLHGLDVTVLRYFTVFGPAGRPDMSIFRFIKRIDEGSPIELYGDGTQSRDFTYVDDVARGTILAAKPVGYEIVNIGGGHRPMSLRSAIEFIEGALGRKAVISEMPFHNADIRDTWADISKAERLFGWRPKVDPTEGFSRCVDWYRANRDWLLDIRV